MSDDGNEIIHEDVSETSWNEKNDDMEDGVWEEPEQMVVNEEKMDKCQAYVQIQQQMPVTMITKNSLYQMMFQVTFVI